MAFIKCSGGGKLKETVLWENPNLTKAFAGQPITLSDDINNYDYIAGYCMIHKNYDNYRPRYMMTVEDYKLTSRGAFPNPANVCSFTFVMDTYPGVERRCYYLTDTTMHIPNGQRVNGTTANDYCIPTKICGAKY